MPNANSLPVFITLAVFFTVALIMLWVFASLFRIWLQGKLAGVSVSVFDLLGMRLRRIDANSVVRSLILATQSGAPISHVELQRAYLRGVDLEKVTLAHIQAQRRNLGTTFEELVELELQDRLAAKLKE